MVWDRTMIGEWFNCKSLANSDKLAFAKIVDQAKEYLIKQPHRRIVTATILLLVSVIIDKLV